MPESTASPVQTATSTPAQQLATHDHTTLLAWAAARCEEYDALSWQQRRNHTTQLRQDALRVQHMHALLRGASRSDLSSAASDVRALLAIGLCQWTLPVSPADQPPPADVLRGLCGAALLPLLMTPTTLLTPFWQHGLQALVGHPLKLLVFLTHASIHAPEARQPALLLRELLRALPEPACQEGMYALLDELANPKGAGADITALVQVQAAAGHRALPPGVRLLRAYYAALEISTGVTTLAAAPDANLDALLMAAWQWLRAEAGRAAALTEQGSKLAAAGDDTAALTAYTEALDTHPEYAPAAFQRGLLHRQQARPDAALADMERTLASDPSFQAAHAHRGALLLQRGQLHAALSDYTQAIKHDPRNPELYEQRAHAYELQNDDRRARIDERKARTLRRAQQPEPAASTADTQEPHTQPAPQNEA